VTLTPVTTPLLPESGSIERASESSGGFGAVLIGLALCAAGVLAFAARSRRAA
jgi:hypothetical protein